jgi:Na+/H+ antiporter NhaD/arsenite permease-like protein
MPFISQTLWHRHYPDFAFSLGALVLAYSLAALGASGRHDMLHAGVEYYAFIALIGGLYIVSGGIFIDIRDRATPLGNTLLLGAGCLLANLLGTTGASVLLIRPFMRMNRGRLRPIHVVFFILTVSNCAGALTPIGDPPLYLGFLKGVPFFWTLERLWPMWLLVNGLLLLAFFIIDSRITTVSGGVPHTHADHAHVFDPHDRTPLITGWPSVLFLLLLVAGVFIDPFIRKWGGGGAAWLDGIPIGATFQIAVALCAYAAAKPSIRHSNQFSFEPVKEVGVLFLGIFLTMAPALQILSTHAPSLGLETPTQFYFLTGALSAVLDNAPTYLAFLQVALGTLHVPMTPDGLAQFIDSSYDLAHSTGRAVHLSGQALLQSIALGAVFFGALTYIGNGPNFMVKAIVDAAHDQAVSPTAAPGQKLLGTKMPSFFGYMLLALLLLFPILVVNWLVFIR